MVRNESPWFWDWDFTDLLSYFLVLKWLGYPNVVQVVARGIIEVSFFFEGLYKFYRVYYRHFRMILFSSVNVGGFGWKKTCDFTYPLTIQQSYWKWLFSSWIFPWKTVILHSYVSQYQRITNKHDDKTSSHWGRCNLQAQATAAGAKVKWAPIAARSWNCSSDDTDQIVSLRKKWSDLVWIYGYLWYNIVNLWIFRNLGKFDHDLKKRPHQPNDGECKGNHIVNDGNLPRDFVWLNVYPLVI